MRIVNVKKQITVYLELLEPKIKSSTTTPNYYTIENWGQIYYALTELQSYGFIKNEIKQIFSLGIQFQTQTEKLNMDQAMHKGFDSRLKNAKLILSKSIELISEFFSNDAEDQVNIKLPNDITLSELSEIIKDIDYIFNKCRVLSGLNNKESVIIRKVDTGSIWLIIGISTVAVITAIGGLTKMALEICQKVLDVRKGIHQIRVLKSGANVIEAMEKEVLAKIKVESRIAAETFLKNIKTTETNDEANENITSLAIGIEKMINLYFKGVEIYASLEEPKDVASAFPNQNEIANLTNEILKLPIHQDNQD